MKRKNHLNELELPPTLRADLLHLESQISQLSQDHLGILRTAFLYLLDQVMQRRSPNHP